MTLITLSQVRQYGKRARQTQKEFLVKHWDYFTRQEFRERFCCSQQHLQDLINEAKKEHSLADKRKTYAKTSQNHEDRKKV